MPERDQCSGGFFFSQKLASPAVFFPGKFENLEAPVSLEQGTARGLGGQCRGLESVRVGRLVEEGGARYLEIRIMMIMMRMRMLSMVTMTLMMALIPTPVGMPG